jgi:hypothetical protein
MSRALTSSTVRSLARLSSLSAGILPSASHLAPSYRPLMSSFSSSSVLSSSFTSSVSASSPSPLDAPTVDNTIFFLCDIQETFRDKLFNWSGIVASGQFLTKISSLLQIPLLITEQKPFKPTIKEFDHNQHPACRVYSKTLFSMLTDEVVHDLTNSPLFKGRKQIVLYGIEAHVCVMQTVLDLLRSGYHVRLVMDGISSGSSIDYSAALERYRVLAQQSHSSGGILTLTSAEGVLFEIVKDASNPVFKSLLPIIKDYGVFKRGAVQNHSKM